MNEYASENSRIFQLIVLKMSEKRYS